MKYTVIRQRIDILGAIWWPMGATAGQSRDLSAYDLANIGDPANRDDVERWLCLNSGDFSSITDFRADFDIDGTHIVHEWAKGEESDFAFIDCFFGDAE